MRGLILLSALASLCAHAAPAKIVPPAAAQRAAAAIDPDLLRAHVRFLASDLLEGRGPGTRGDALAQAYIAAQFEAAGLKPAGSDGYLQPFDIIGVTSDPKTLTVQPAKGKPVTLQHGPDFIAVAGRAQERSGFKDAELVFVGFGIVAPEFDWDDFKGVDLKGKVLLMMNSDPEHDPSIFAGKARLWYGRWDYKYLAAARAGAVGAILIHTTPSAGYSWPVVQTSWTGEQFEVPSADLPTLEVEGWFSEEVSRKVAALGGRDLDALREAALKRDFKPIPLGVTVSTSFPSKVARRKTANVLGMLPGSDPKLAGEVVVYTAHHDHLGINPNAKPGEDAIYNGAVDNALGVSSMLGIARAFSALPKKPRRSILFAAVAAEEQGLLGSEFLSQNLPVPAGRLTANINLDGGNIWGRTRDVTVIGLGKSNLDRSIEGLARWQGRVVKADQMSDRGFFYRSDQFNFARIGVPAAYFGSGMDFIGRPPGWGKAQREAWEEKAYHQPPDELRDDWDLSGAVEDSRLAFLLGARVANQNVAPRWTPGDEFESVRKKALEEAEKR